MKNIGNALTRKLGPLPAWVWAIAAAALVYYYRNRLSSMSGTGTGSVGPAAVTPQPDTTLAPGESVYDPNTGSLLTSPVPPDTGGGGTGDTTGGGTDPSAAIDALFNALAAAIPPAPPLTSADPTVSDAPGPPDQTKPPQARPKVGTHIGRSIVAPYGAKKPPFKKGYRRVGKGHGAWLYVPIGKRKPKTKAGHTHTKPKPSSKPSHGRSKTSVRNRVGGRTHRGGGGKAAPPAAHPRAHTSPASRRVSSRHRTTPVQAGPVKQRPVAKHPKPSVRPKPHPAAHHAAPPRHSGPRSRPKRKGY